MGPTKMLKTFRKIGLVFSLSALRLLLGNYIKISNSKYICYFLKLYCIFIVICLITWHYHLHVISSLINIGLLEYFCFAVYYLITSQEYLMKFRIGISTSDAVMGYKTLPYINLFVYVVVGSAFTIRILLVILQLHPSFTIASNIMRISTDINYMAIWFLLYVLYTRIVLIKKCLVNNFVPINIVGKDQVNKNINVVRKCMGYYKNLLDNMRIIDHPLQILVSLSMLYGVPKWVAGMYYAIKIWVHEDISKTIFFWILETIFSIVMVTLPAFITELINYETDEIKSTLVTQLIRCSDQSLRFELETALQYFHVRPFSFVICRAVPININLPFSLISLCITYVIVLMQFSHYIGRNFSTMSASVIGN